MVWDYTLDTSQTFNEQNRSSSPLHDDSNGDQGSSASSDGSSDPDVDNTDSSVHSTPHTVVFKCIGAVRDPLSQAALRSSRDRLLSSWTVPVRMRPEPSNIFNSKAFFF